MYKKRQGTSGIRGQLYETKLISLIHYRTKFDEDIEDYTLASNVSDIGTFDDICIRATVKVNGGNKPVAVFIQAKHREGNNVQLTLNRKRDLAKWFSSYINIRRLFKPDNKDVMFKGNFQEIECLFILYTTAKADLNTKQFKSNFADKLNSWIGTGDEGLQPCHKEEDVVFLCEIIMKEQFAALAVQLAKFLTDYAKDNKENENNDGSIMPMYDELMLQYHVILGQKVLDVSQIKCKNEKDEHRVASFKTEFFTNDDKFIILFKDTLFIEMLGKRKLKEAKLYTLLSKLFTKPLDIVVLSSLIGNVVKFNDKTLKLEFVSQSMSEYWRRKLEEVHVLQSQVNEAIDLGAKDMLKNRNFKVPTAFGNKDLTIRGKEDNVEPSVLIASVINNMKNKLVSLIKASPTENIIVIDESIGKEFLNLNAGLAGTIGNILVSNENPKYMKFTDKDVSADLASRLYSEVQSVIPNLHDYKFHIKVKTFPKHIFDCEDDENLEILKDQVTLLAEHMGQFLCKEDDSILPMNDIMSRYHVLVALKAIKISEIQSEDDEHRLASFRQEFFESDEEFVILLKKALYKEILKIRKFDKYDSDLAVKEILKSCQFKVPAAFGNKDITINIKKSKTERRLDYLKLKISELITKSGADKIVTIDESLGDGLLKLNGGIAGIVGNLLIAEENTKLMMFTDNWESLGELSKRLFMKLKSGTKNLHEYRFNVKVKKFPKLSFKRYEDDENLAKDFLKKLLFFTSQADEQRVENCLKDEIEDQQCLKVYNVRVTVDAVFQQYHKLIQTWWMLKVAPYLTKQSEHYEDALALIVDKPVVSIISLIYMTKIKNNLDYTFNEKSLSHLKLEDQPSATIFVTTSCALTVAKMVQSLKRTDHFVINLEYILDLPEKDYKTVTIELTKTNENQLIILVCNILNKNWIKKLKYIAKLLEKKRIIFVIKETLVETIQTYFVHANNVVIDEKCSLIQMSKISQKNILENTKVTFQDVKLSLASIIDEHSMGFVEGEVLYTAMNNDSINLGETISNSNYEKVKHLYIDRRVGWRPVSKRVTKAECFASKTEYVLTLNDIPDDGDVALVTATPGMGKSTLLTHLSLKTKELKPTVWIVRINLLYHSEKFSRWQENKTNIGFLESLKFFCEVLAEKQRRNIDVSMELEESNGIVTLKSFTGDQWTDFELKMFLDYYNRKEIIFIFDGFDEICPTYMDEVLTLLTTVGIHLQKHKMWITTRPYDKVISSLEEKFGNSCEIEYFSDMDQNLYLVNFWKANINLRHLTKKQCDNLCSFMEFMTNEYIFEDVENQGAYQHLFFTVCFNFLYYLRGEINTCPAAFAAKICDQLYNNFDYQVRCYVENFSTPLHLYLFADYFQNRIKDESIIPNRWNLNINAYTVYESFIETMLKRRFQEKNKIDLYNPDNKNIYENVRVEFLTKHKKLGAYAIFGDSDKIFSMQELNEIEDTMDKIHAGTEKSGFIHSIQNGLPHFVHRTFTEYFAAQHICDLLKAENREDKLKLAWDFILNEVFEFYNGIRDILCYMIKSDLRTIVKDHEQIIFDLLLEKGKDVFTFYADNFRKYPYLNIKTSLLYAMDDEFDHFMARMFNLIGAITGIVGNLLISDNNTKLKKFSDNWESLGEISKRLFIKLQTRIKNVNKFDAKLKKCPKLSFQRDVENSAKDILKQLIFSTNQADNTGIEKFLKNEIVDHQCAKVDKIEVIFQYLNLIKRWWMVKQATKHKSNINDKRFRRRKYKLTTYFGAVILYPSYRTNEKALSCLKLKDQPSAKIFVTENTALTVGEIVISLNCINRIVINLDCIFNMPASRYNDFLKNLTDTKRRELFIIVCNNLERAEIKHSELIAKLLESKRIIFVLNETLVKRIQSYFLQAKNECNLTQMSKKSHMFILESAKVMLEDLEMCLDSIIEDQEEREGEVLNTNNPN